MLFHTFIVPLIALIVAPFASASAAGQFKLDHTENASQCFLDCHARAINSVNLPGQPSNSFQAYGANCRMTEWQELMSQCLVLSCQSPPDVAYAIEYTASVCGRAGEKVQLELPDSYLRTADGAYFRSSLYLNSNDAPRQVISAGALGTAIAIGVVGAALI